MFTLRHAAPALLLLLAAGVLACSRGDDARTDTAAAGTTPAATTPAAPASADDAEDRVEAALDADSGLSRFGLDADDDDGKVVLKGKVATEAQKAAAAAVATRVAAGVAVDNRIRVETGAGGGARPADVDEAEDRVEDAIEADSTLRGLDIDVDEENGQLVLDGKVRTAAQKTMAEQIATRTATGITVVNKLRVEP